MKDKLFAITTALLFGVVMAVTLNVLRRDDDKVLKVNIAPAVNNVRAECIALNERFLSLSNVLSASELSRGIQMINVGIEPDDGTGDTFRAALSKIRRNLDLILLAMLHLQSQ